MELIRVNKYLASLGVASRRHVDNLILQGRVQINNRLAIPGDKVNPVSDNLKIDGKSIHKNSQKFIYIALNKPVNILSTSCDPHGRTTVLDLVKVKERVFIVGRLDYNSSGLILLTNDGDFALKMTHPRYHLPKTYLITIAGKVSPEKIKQLEQGIDLSEGTTLPAKVQKITSNTASTTLKIILHEGKKRQIRRMCASLRLHLMTLHRIQIGPVLLGNLEEGAWRFLTASELSQLQI